MTAKRIVIVDDSAAYCDLWSSFIRERYPDTAKVEAYSHPYDALPKIDASIDLLIVGSWFGVEKLARRIEATTISEVQEREEPAKYTVDMIRDYPVFGAGPGSFYVTFPRYRPEKVVSFFDWAHNDYAQFAAETGLVGLGMMGLLVVTTLGAAIRAQWLRRDPLRP